MHVANSLCASSTRDSTFILLHMLTIANLVFFCCNQFLILEHILLGQIFQISKLYLQQIAEHNPELLCECIRYEHYWLYVYILPLPFSFYTIFLITSNYQQCLLLIKKQFTNGSLILTSMSMLGTSSLKQKPSP